MALCPEDSQRTIDKATELPFSEAQVAGVVERYLETNGFVQSLEAFRRENVHLSGDRGSAFEQIPLVDHLRRSHEFQDHVESRESILMEDLDDRVGNLFLNTISKLQMVLQDYCTVSEGFGRSKCLALNDFLKNLKSLNLNSLEPCTIGDGGAQRRKKRRREPQQREDITMERNDANDSNVPKYSFPGPEKNPSDLTDNSHSVSLEQIPGLISHQPLDKDTQSIVFSATSSNECSNLQLSAHDFDNSLASASNQAELLVQSGLVDIDKFLDSIHKQQQ